MPPNEKGRVASAARSSQFPNSTWGSTNNPPQEAPQGQRRSWAELHAAHARYRMKLGLAPLRVPLATPQDVVLAAQRARTENRLNVLARSWELPREVEVELIERHMRIKRREWLGAHPAEAGGKTWQAASTK
jgi:hypothetical protein